MAKQRSGRRLLVAIAWLSVVIIVPVAVYAYYVWSQLQEQQARNARALERTAGYLEDVLSNVHTTVESLLLQPKYLEEFERRQRYLEVDVDKFDAITNLLAGTQGCEACSVCHSGEDCESAKQDTPVCDIAVKQCKLQKTLEVRYDLDEAGVPYLIVTPMSSSSSLRDEEKEIAKFRIDLETIVRELPWEGFDLLLLADDTGKVVVEVSNQSSIAGHGHAHVRNLTALRTLDRDGWSMTGLQAASQSRRIQLAEGTYQLISQPVSTRFARATKGPWVLVGLVPTHRTWREALGVFPGLPVTLLFVVGITLLAWPFLKLHLMARTERLKRSDACFLVLATIAVSMLATFLLLDLSKYSTLRRASHRALSSLSEEVERRFREEMQDWQRKLRSIPSSPGLHRWSEGVNPGLKPDDAGANAKPKRKGANELYYTLAFWMREDGWQCAKGAIGEPTPLVRLHHRNYFKSAAADNLWKWTCDSAAADNLRKWTCDPDVVSGGGPSCAGVPTEEFYIESALSVTTGERFTALSMHSPELPNEFDLCGEAPVVAMSGRPVSVTRPVLPYGVGVAVVDEEGRTLYHSNVRRSVHETLFQEMEDPDRLRAALHSHSVRDFRSNYLAKPHQVHVQPMRDLPWWIVVFRDEEPLVTYNREVIGWALIFVGFYVALGVMLTLLYLGFRSLVRPQAPSIRRVLWPDRREGRAYRRLAFVYGAAIAAFGLPLVFLGVDGAEDHWVLASMLFPYGVVIASFVCWRLISSGRKDRDAGRSSDGEHSCRKESVMSCIRTRYAIVGLELLTLTGVLPTAALFLVAWEKERERHQRLAMVKFAEQVDARSCRVKEEFEELGWPTEGSPDVADRTADDRDLYLSTTQDLVCFKEDTHGTRVPSPPKGLDTVMDWVASILPVYTETSRRLRYQLPGDSHDRALVWERVSEEDSRVGWRLDWNETSCGTRFHSVFWDEPVVESNSRYASVVPVLVFLLGLSCVIAVARWMHYWAGRVLFTHSNPYPKSVSVTDLLASPPHRGIAVVTSPEDRRRILTHFPSPGNGTDGEKISVDEDRRCIVVDWLCVYLEDQKVLSSRLRELERLVERAEGPLLVLSAVDPMELLFGPKRQGPSASGQTQEGEAEPAPLRESDARRWSILFSEFDLLYVTVDRGDTEKGGDSPRSRYWPIWENCTEEERLTLVQLARERFVNPKQDRIVHQLLSRGLVVRRPDLQLMDERFRRFVLVAETRSVVKRWERSAGLGWRELRWLVVVAGLVVAGLLYATQRAAFEASIGFLAAAAAGIPAFLKLLAFRDQGTTQSSP